MENGVQGEYRDGVITISPTAKDQRVTLDLGPDYPKLLADAVRRSGKAETGKDTFAYQNVSEWHYFVNDILFAEQQSEKYEPYRVTVNIKQRPDGMFVYSFSAENETRLNAPQTLHAAVDNGIIAATDVQSNNSITNSAREVKESGKKSQSSAPQEEHRTLLHELQHSVQEREGRPVGASPDYWRSRGEADPYGAYRDTAGEIEARQTEQRGALTSEERRQKTPDFGWDRAVFAQDDGINYEIKYPHYTREQIEENSKLLHGMDTVSVLTGQEFAKGEVQLKDQVLEFFHQLGNNVHSEQFGDVGLVKSSWRSDLRHGMTNEKAISFVAVPDVIQKGVVIDVYSPGPNTYDRIVVAAPITIAGKDYYMAVMLQWDQQSQRLYLHDVIAKEKQGMQNHTQTGLYANDGNEVSRGSTHLDISSILRNALNYNHFVKNTSDVQSSIGLSYDELVRRARERYPKGAGATADGNASPTDGILRRGAHHTSRSERRVPRGVFGAQPSDSEALSAEMNDSRTAENAIKQATGYGEYGVRAISDLLNTTEGMSFDQLKSRFQSAYEAGLTDMPVAKANLSTDIQRLAFNAGKQDYIMSMKREKVKGATVWGKAGGVIENDYSKKLDAQTHDTLHTIGRATGTKIIIEELPAEMNANGYYKSSDGTIHIDADTTDPVMTVAKHEITHRMQELAPEAYTQFRDYAVQMENRGAEFGNPSAVEIKQEQYREGSGGKVNLDVEAAMDEIAANYTEKILRDEKTLHDFVTDMSETEEKRSIGQKFFDAVHEFLRKLKEHFGNGKKARAKMDAEAVRTFGATVSELERAERLWKRAYSEAVQAAQGEAGQARLQAAQSRDTMGESRYAMKEPSEETKNALYGIRADGTIRAAGRARRLQEVTSEKRGTVRASVEALRTGRSSGARNAWKDMPASDFIHRMNGKGRAMDSVGDMIVAYKPLADMDATEIMRDATKRFEALGYTVYMTEDGYSVWRADRAQEDLDACAVSPASGVAILNARMMQNAADMENMYAHEELHTALSWRPELADKFVRVFWENLDTQSEAFHELMLEICGMYDDGRGLDAVTDAVLEELMTFYAGTVEADVQDLKKLYDKSFIDSSAVLKALLQTQKLFREESSNGHFPANQNGRGNSENDRGEQKGKGKARGYDAGEIESLLRGTSQKTSADPDSGQSGGLTQDGRVRFSLKGQKDLERENAKLRETVAGLREQFRRTEFAKVDRKALDSFAKTLLKDYQSSADVEETRAALDSLYTYLANGENEEGPVWGEAYRRAFETAAGILESASVTEDEVYRQYSRLRRYLREQKMHVPREMWSEFDSAGGYNALRRAYMGRLSLSSTDGAGIDQVYQELSQMYPEFFDEAEISNPADQLLRIAEVLDGLEPYEVNPYSANMRESASWLANDILERFYELPQAKPTFADKAEGRLTDQVIRDGKKLETLREQKNARIAQLIAENRQKVKEAAARERQKRKREVDELKATVRTLQHMLKAAQDGGVDSRTMDAYREKVLKGYRGGSDTGVRLAIMSLEPKDRQAVLAEYEKLVKDYGAIPAGEKPAREVQVPKKTAPGKKVSQTVRTVLEAGATPEGAIPTIEQMVADGTFSYDAYTDEQAMADAGSTIERDGFETALSDWLSRMMRGEVSKKNTAMGWALYNNAANAGDVKTAMTVLNQMASMILMGRYMQRRTAYPEMFISTF